MPVGSAPPPPPPTAPSLGTSIYGGPPQWTAPTITGGPTGAGPLPLAGVGSRLLGLILDWLVGVVAAIPVLIGVAILLAVGPKQTYSNTDAEGVVSTSRGPAIGMILIVILFAVVGLVGFQVWNHVVRLGRTGQSLGKQAVGIKVVGGSDGQPIGGGRALGRALFAGFISGSFCYLGYLWALWDPKKQTWHDKIVDSVVVSAR